MLILKDVSKTFDLGATSKQVFNQLSLTVQEDEFVTIIGSNGAGKSTLLNLIDGNEWCDSGSIHLGTKEITNIKPYKRAREMSRVFQDPSLGTSPNMTVTENLSMALHKNKLLRLSKAVQKSSLTMYKELLTPLGLGLETQLDTLVKLLSGGQRQALALVMATLVKPKLLLLDEHTAALDPKTSKTILQLTSKLVNEHRIPTLMVTHNMKDALTYGNRLMMLNQGNVILDVKGKAKEMLSPEDLVEKFRESSSTLSDRMVLA